MTAIATSSTSADRARADRRTVDVFGVRWPRYKAEALIAALLVLAFGLLLTLATGVPSFTPAVLTAAGAGTVVWWAARTVHDRV
ncbi:hypothetical protein [Tsukamurella sp. PLM1]|uniref:hypothetical protein n=1 Tax=Tsukamurella sp. PLM1 TaxID=2929795 RepID=UPI0020571B9A|nr:hypothetical protein [Tsukamurella sp. PLM1]BDH58013.1 hypothetical protein MTP03_29520 [Tsukamurella sp. PLM1]